MNGREAAAKVSLKRLYSEAMSLRACDEIVLLLDSRTYELWQPACDAAAELGLHFALLLYPVHLQKDLEPPLPSIYRRLCMGAQGAVTMLTEAPSCTEFRREFVTIARDANCRVVHMPGIDLEILAASTHVPFGTVSSLANHYAELLEAAGVVTITTQDSSGQHHELTFSLSGRHGYADGGIVEPGEIVNFPTGEAYSAPLDGTANGTIVINGSIPTYVLRQHDLILQFRDGVMIPTGTVGADHPRVQGFLEELAQGARSDGGLSYGLAEIGIGCNPGYTTLTGREIVDEKVAGTIHIALGDSTIVGGSTKAKLHLDLVVYPVSLKFDGQEVALPEVGGA